MHQFNCFKEAGHTPIKSKLSFVPLIRELKKEAERDDTIAGLYKRIKAIPELNAPIEDKNILTQHKNIIEEIIRTLVSPALCSGYMLTINRPFSFDIIFETHRFIDVFCREDRSLSFGNINKEKMVFQMIVAAYGFILGSHYNKQYRLNSPFIPILKHNDTGLTEHFNVNVNTQYIDIKQIGGNKRLTEEELQTLLENAHDIKVWKDMLDIENFVFEGIAILDFTDITEKQILSTLKSDLLERDTIISGNKFVNVKNNIRSLLKLPDVNVGLLSIDIENSQNTPKVRILNGLLENSKYVCEDYKNSSHTFAAKSRNPYLISDLTLQENKSPIEKKYLENGYKSMAIMPLINDNKLVGMLELASPNAGQLNYIYLKKLFEVLPILGISLKRVAEEFNNTIQATIKEECTAIHPTVEWKFQEAAERLLDKRNENIAAVMEDIVFPDVYPLYGATDIRGSSAERNKAIQADLSEQLSLAGDVVKLAFEKVGFPMLDHLHNKIEKHKKKVKEGLHAGDEISILDFLQNDVEPLFKHMADYENEELKNATQKYTNALDKNLKVVYKCRKDYEESLTYINDTVGAFIEQEEVKAQEMFPHYFEKYKTDGIEYNIYLGASLVKNQEYCDIFLENMRLWQLINMCKVTKLTEKIKPKLKVQLGTTQLILVHSSPLAIRFRYDEKQFDVDGAYNIRYEIIKKRIDKSLIKGTDERITKVGHIAIIYSQTKEQKEYEQYIEYLIDKNYIKDSVEYHDLEDLQGAHGLKAIRIDVNTD